MRVVAIFVVTLFLGCLGANSVMAPLPAEPANTIVNVQICWGPADYIKIGHAGGYYKCRRETPFGTNPRHHTGRNSYEDLYEIVKNNPGSFCTTMEGERVDCLRVPVYANGVRTITDSIGGFSVTVPAGVDSVRFSMDEDELPMRFFAWEGARSNCVYERMSECNTFGSNNQVYTFLNYLGGDTTVATRPEKSRAFNGDNHPVILSGTFVDAAMFRIRADKDTLYLFDTCLARTRQCTTWDDARDSTKLAPWSSVQLGDPYGVVNWLTFVPDWNREVIIRSWGKEPGAIARYRYTFQKWLWERGFFVVYDNSSLCYATRMDSGADFLPNLDPMYAHDQLFGEEEDPAYGGPRLACNVKLTEWRTR